jgi:hypothetical protein
MKASGKQRIPWNRANELGYVVCQRSDLRALSAWYKRCLKLAWPCASVIVRGHTAEVKLDAFTARRQALGRGGALAVRDVVSRWAARTRTRSAPTELWTGPVCFGLGKMPAEDAEQLAAEMLAAAREAEPDAFARPRSQAEYDKRVGFLRRWEHEAEMVKSKAKDGKAAAGDLAAYYAPSHAEIADAPAPLAPAVSQSEWRTVVEHYEGACAYCERRGMLLIRDQMVPAVRGGSHQIGNVVPACVGCNGEKAARAAAEFVASRPDLPARRLREAFGIPRPAQPAQPPARRRR